LSVDVESGSGRHKNKKQILYMHKNVLTDKRASDEHEAEDKFVN
jgi:hypothetical protein